mmetsp:Transcript_23578/g.35314  ORF Transcript_23578/g.35314 Transcript_23578/m.35314 type:complete len:665 (+) Transcript_23578:45-2039(+)|eukprot:CAMPEP_0167759004 /NCGR_PEP_ID=MMETSP0110_2-20121227/10785_1 /TAXON_ID=629695 /ORGANISM="Gymnochlora sp., Strain CCMP2014" /LENGTH=664 /DNA_ID=CAMNT_0007645347 /DNA_START=39 /DNA_END=2033 /DNA_ORIENTATION=-
MAAWCGNYRLNAWRKLFLIEGPLILILSYPASLAAGWNYSEGSNGRPLFFALQHYFMTYTTLLVWHVVCPKFWGERHPVRWRIMFAAMRAIIVFAREMVVKDGNEAGIHIMSAIDATLMVLLNWGFPFYWYFEAYNYWPKFRCGEVYAWIVMISFGPVQFTVRYMSENYEHYDLMVFAWTFAYVIFVFMLLFAAMHKAIIGIKKSFTFAMKAAIVAGASQGVASTISTVRQCRLYLGSNYSAILGLILFNISIAFGITFLSEVVDFIRDVQVEDLQLIFVPLQFVNEFFIGMVFLDTGLSVEFAVMVIIVLLSDYFLESGLVFEWWYNIVKRKGIERKAMYIAKKYFFIMTKVFAEVFATPAVFIMVLMEHLLSSRVGISLVTRNNFQDLKSEQRIALLEALAILMVIETIASRFNFYTCKKRAIRLQQEVARTRSKSATYDPKTGSHIVPASLIREIDSALQNQLATPSMENMRPKPRLVVGDVVSPGSRQRRTFSDRDSLHTPPATSRSPPERVGLEFESKKALEGSQERRLNLSSMDKSYHTRQYSSASIDGKTPRSSTKRNSARPAKGRRGSRASTLVVVDGGVTKEEKKDGIVSLEVLPPTNNSRKRSSFSEKSMQSVRYFTSSVSMTSYVARNANHRALFSIGAMHALLTCFLWFEPD